MQVVPPASERQEQLIRPTSAPVSSGGGFQAGGIRQIVIMLVVALLAAFALAIFWVLPQTVTKSDFTKNLQGVASDIAAIKNAQKGDETTLATLSTQVTGLNSQFSNFQSSLNTFAKTLADHTTQLSTTPTRAQLDALQNQLNTLKATVEGLPASLKADYNGQIATLQTSLTSISQQVTTLANTVNTTGTGNTGGTTTPTGQVSAVVIGNSFTGSQIMSFLAGVAANTTSSQSFTYQLTNNTGKSITNIQLAIGLELLDANNTIIQAGLPSTTSVSLSSSGTAVVWSQQTTGIPYILGFANSVPTGIFGGLGVMSQGTGTATYNITVTVTSGVNATPAFNVFPIVKVVSFS